MEWEQTRRKLQEEAERVVVEEAEKGEVSSEQWGVSSEQWEVISDV